MTAVSVVRKPANLDVWYGNDSIYNVLETHGLMHGYSTAYWYTNSITVLSESRINVLGVKVIDGELKMGDYQNKGSWYEETPTDEKTFLICLERELFNNPWLEEDAVEILRATQYTPKFDLIEGYFILVYDRDIFTEQLRQELASEYAGTQIMEN